MLAYELEENVCSRPRAASAMRVTPATGALASQDLLGKHPGGAVSAIGEDRGVGHRQGAPLRTLRPLIWAPGCPLPSRAWTGPQSSSPVKSQPPPRGCAMGAAAPAHTLLSGGHTRLHVSGTAGAG